MPTNFPSGLRSRGVPVEGLGLGQLFPLTSVDVWYVSTSGNDTNGGKTETNAKLTIAAAIAAAIAGDVIIIMAGTYIITTLLTPKANQTFIAATRGPVPTVTIEGAIADLVDVEVNGVKFIGIEFQATHNDVARLVKVADTAAVVGVTFLDCWFDGVTFTTVNGISAIDGTFTTTGLAVVGCRFIQCNVGIDVGVLGIPLAVIKSNTFQLNDVGGTDVGVALADTGAGATGYGFLIEDNAFIGPTDAGADAVGITIAGTENTTAIGGIGRNFFYNCNVAAITIDKISKSQVNNYVGDAATGGTLVDPGT